MLLLHQIAPWLSLLCSCGFSMFAWVRFGAGHLYLTKILINKLYGDILTRERSLKCLPLYLSECSVIIVPQEKGQISCDNAAQVPAKIKWENDGPKGTLLFFIQRQDDTELVKIASQMTLLQKQGRNPVHILLPGQFQHPKVFCSEFPKAMQKMKVSEFSPFKVLVTCSSIQDWLGLHSQTTFFEEHLLIN